MQPGIGLIEGAGEELAQTTRRVEADDWTGAIQPFADVVEPDDLAIGRVEKRTTAAIEVPPRLPKASRIPFSLGKDVLGAAGSFLASTKPTIL